MFTWQGEQSGCSLQIRRERLVRPLHRSCRTWGHQCQAPPTPASVGLGMPVPCSQPGDPRATALHSRARRAGAQALTHWPGKRLGAEGQSHKNAGVDHPLVSRGKARLSLSPSQSCNHSYCEGNQCMLAEVTATLHSNASSSSRPEGLRGARGAGRGNAFSVGVHGRRARCHALQARSIGLFPS